MKIVLNNILILLLILSPLEVEQMMDFCHEMQNPTTAMINCQNKVKNQSEQQSNHKQLTINCCESGQCSCVIHVLATPLLLTKESFKVIDKPYLWNIQQTVPFKAFQAPFRPPIS